MRSFDKARENYERALKIKPAESQFKFQLGRLFETLGEVEEAKAEYEEIIAQDTDYVPALKALGRILLSLSQFRDCAPLFRRVLEISPEDDETYNDLGVTLLRQGKGEDAVEHFCKAIFFKNDADTYFFNLGLSLRDVRFKAPNKPLLKTALEMLEKKNMSDRGKWLHH